MKRVLIVTNLLPHLIRPNSRVPGLVRYLFELGWEAVVLTPPFPERMTPPFRTVVAFYRGDIFWLWRKIFKLLGFKTDKSILNQIKEKTGITSQKSFIDYIFNLYMTLFAYPDEERRWERPALRAADKLLEKEKFDAIISSSSPVTAHIIANKLKEKYKIPWVAELRDLWTQNHNYPYPWCRKILERKLELKTLKLADVLVTVSMPLAEKLKGLHKKENVFTITNGFDPNKTNEPAIDLTSKFTVTYTGQIYTGKQDPSKFLIALKSLISDGIISPDRVEVRFYGPERHWLGKMIKDYNLSNIAREYGIISREIAIRKQWESQLLLLLDWEDREEKGIYTGKIFEYLAARRPILSTGGFEGDVIEDLLRETKAGVYAAKVDDIKKYLIEFYAEYTKKGRVDFTGDIETINKYSHQKMAKKFADSLNGLV